MVGLANLRELYKNVTNSNKKFNRRLKSFRTMQIEKVQSFINMVKVQQTSITKTVQSKKVEKRYRNHTRRMKQVDYQSISVPCIHLHTY